MNKITCFLVLILIFPLVCGQEIKFSYELGEPKSDIIARMESVINSLDDNQYNPVRFSDIKKEAILSAGDDMKFFEIADIFENTTALFHEAKEKFSQVKENIGFFGKDAFESSAMQNLVLCENFIRDGQYESAILEIENINKIMLISLNEISSDAKESIVELKKELENLSSGSSGFINLEYDIAMAENDGRITELKDVFERIEEINKSVNLIAEIKNHQSYFEEKAISSKIIEDLFDQGFFYIKKSEFSKIPELYQVSYDLFRKSRSLEESYMDLKYKLSSASGKINSSLINVFNVRLSDAYAKYKSADFDSVSVLLQELRNEILEAESNELAMKSLGSESFSIGSFFWHNKKALIIFSISGLIVISMSSVILERLYLKKRLEKLKAEKNNLADMMKSLQEDYFKEKSIPKKTYEVKMVLCQKRFVEVTKELSLNKEKVK